MKQYYLCQFLYVQLNKIIYTNKIWYKESLPYFHMNAFIKDWKYWELNTCFCYSFLFLCNKYWGRSHFMKIICRVNAEFDAEIPYFLKHFDLAVALALNFHYSRIFLSRVMLIFSRDSEIFFMFANWVFLTLSLTSQMQKRPWWKHLLNL